MAVNLPLELPELLPVAGVRIATAAAGIKYSGRTDLVAFELAAGTQCAAVFTRNAFCAAPVTVAREHLAATMPHLLLINSGNANAGTGEQGHQDALDSCVLLADAAGCNANEVLPFSTGVIGESLPMGKFVAAIPSLPAQFDENGWHQAAHGIMTTDTLPKGLSRQIMIGDESVTITGIAKGSGMICPDMATMLAYVATDANVSPELLQQCLQYAADRSFNCISVDGDTSTNDACVLMASGQAMVVSLDDGESGAYQQLRQAITEVCVVLAQAIIRDGEGATKFITIDVEGGNSEADCRQVAYTVAHSPLVKTAFFASDPNWGRILAAVGRAGIETLDVGRVAIYLDDVCIVRDGARATEYTETAGDAVMKQDEITVRIVLGDAPYHAQLWSCDFSYDYVRINAEYRS